MSYKYKKGDRVKLITKIHMPELRNREATVLSVHKDFLEIDIDGCPPEKFGVSVWTTRSRNVTLCRDFILFTNQ